MHNSETFDVPATLVDKRIPLKLVSCVNYKAAYVLKDNRLVKVIQIDSA